jgi:hypothetical protein
MYFIEDFFVSFKMAADVQDGGGISKVQKFFLFPTLLRFVYLQ